jgi:hypothetical protein
MQSKNKPRPTAVEALHIDRLAQLPCVVCGAEGVHVHEFEQGQWFTAIPLCPLCHLEPHGWHGTRERWKLRRMDMLKAINETWRQLA